MSLSLVRMLRGWKPLFQEEGELASEFFSILLDEFCGLVNRKGKIVRKIDMDLILINRFFRGCNDECLIVLLCHKMEERHFDFELLHRTIRVEEGRRVAKRLLKKKGIVWKESKKNGNGCVNENNVFQTNDLCAKTESVICSNDYNGSEIIAKDVDDSFDVGFDDFVGDVNVINAQNDYDLVLFVDNDLWLLIKVVECYLVHVEWQVIALASLNLLNMGSWCYGAVFHKCMLLFVLKFKGFQFTKIL